MNWEKKGEVFVCEANKWKAMEGREGMSLPAKFMRTDYSSVEEYWVFHIDVQYKMLKFGTISFSKIYFYFWHVQLPAKVRLEWVGPQFWL